MTEEITPKRKRGAPPGNHNALKHGFYSRKFKHTDLAGLEEIKCLSLTEEITMMRVSIRRVVEQAGAITDPLQSVEMLRALAGAASSLARLVRAQALIHSPQDEISDSLNRALTEYWEGKDTSPWTGGN